MIDIKRLEIKEVAQQWGTGENNFEVTTFKPISGDDKSTYGIDHSKTALGDLFEQAGLSRLMTNGSPAFRTAETIARVFDISSFHAALIYEVVLSKQGTYPWMLENVLADPEQIVGPNFGEIDLLSKQVDIFSVSNWERVQKKVAELPRALAEHTASVVDQEARLALVGKSPLPDSGVNWTRQAFSQTVILGRANTLGFVNHARDVLHFSPFAATALQIPQHIRPLAGLQFITIFDLSA